MTAAGRAVAAAAACRAAVVDIIGGPTQQAALAAEQLGHVNCGKCTAVMRKAGARPSQHRNAERVAGQWVGNFDIASHQTAGIAKCRWPAA